MASPKKPIQAHVFAQYIIFIPAAMPPNVPPLGAIGRVTGSWRRRPQFSAPQKLRPLTRCRSRSGTLAADAVGSTVAPSQTRTLDTPPPYRLRGFARQVFRAVSNRGAKTFPPPRSDASARSTRSPPPQIARRTTTNGAPACRPAARRTGLAVLLELHPRSGNSVSQVAGELVCGFSLR